jgi:hypothetical protein
MAVISEWLGVIGVVLGSALGYTSSTFQESLRRRHEDIRLRQSEKRDDRIRLEDRKFDAYTALITAANRVHAVARYPVIAELELVGRKLQKTTDPVRYMSQLKLAYESFDAALSPAFLLAGSEEVRGSLRKLTSATINLIDGIINFGDDEATRLLAEQRNALRATEAAMRREIGLDVLAHREESSAPAGEKPRI